MTSRKRHKPVDYPLVFFCQIVIVGVVTMSDIHHHLPRIMDREHRQFQPVVGYDDAWSRRHFTIQPLDHGIQVLERVVMEMDLAIDG